jgi:DNA-binding NtrC family response regulator
MKNVVTILVVDDDTRMRSLLQGILERDGYSVLTARDGAEALELIHRRKVDIVISDMTIPGVDGFELLKIVKEELPHIGMIMMASSSDTYAVKDALLLGADEYVTKPFRSHEISMVVERAYWRILSDDRNPTTAEEPG